MPIYYPYFRGKQYELVAIRESAPLLAQAEFVPIVEPVKETFSGLRRAINAVTDADGQAIVVVNPVHGHHAQSSDEIENLFQQDLADKKNIAAGILVTNDMTVNNAVALYEQYKDRDVALIHSGFNHGRQLAEALEEDISRPLHVFVEQHHGKLYRKHFTKGTRILLRDGFRRQKNRDYPDREKFSDLHLTYEDEGADGFGDYLIVGDEFSETGGPAYAVAIHLTFIDSDKDDEMHIFHFVSVRTDTPTDPAGKFGEALEKLVEEVRSSSTPVLRTEAVKEYLDLHERKHFPGLGYVKKLSMKHHMETLAAYFGR